MQRNDYITAIIAGICLMVLIYLLIKISSLHSIPPTEPLPSTPEWSQDTLLQVSADSNRLPVSEPKETEIGNRSEKPYLVVAGSFKYPESAKQVAEQIRQLGYPEVEVGYFNQATIASVIVKRLDDQQAAAALVRELKEKHHTDAYIHIKQ